MTQLYSGGRMLSNKLDMSSLKFCDESYPQAADTAAGCGIGSFDMRHRIRRSVTTAVVALVAATTLSGCFAVPDLSNARRIDVSEAPQPTPSDDTGVDDGTVAATTMSFDDGAAIAPGSIAQWSDGLLTDDGWTLTSPDVGEGGWTYTSADGTCSAAFWQGQVYDMTATDDRSASDFMLGALISADAATVEQAGQDGTLAYFSGANRVADSRYISQVEADRSWAIAVRGFAVLKSTVYLIVDCSTDQAETVIDEVITKNPIIVG